MQERGNDRKQNKRLFHSNGITYFSKKTERSFFFVLTLIVLLWGILTKLGIL